MGKYVIKRLLQLIPVVLGITFLSFAMMRLAGGDAVTYMYENAGTAVSQEVINEARAEYGLDQPFLVQYGKWLKGMLTGNLGESYVSHQDVAASFAAKLPATLLLADEPTSALDVTLQKQVVEKLLELRKEEGTAMAVVTHNIGVVRAMADRVLVLKEGCAWWSMAGWKRCWSIRRKPIPGSFCLPPLPCGGQKRKEKGR